MKFKISIFAIGTPSRNTVDLFSSWGNNINSDSLINAGFNTVKLKNAITIPVAGRDDSLAPAKINELQRLRRKLTKNEAELKICH